MNTAEKIAREILKSLHQVASEGDCQVDADGREWNVTANMGLGSLIARDTKSRDLVRLNVLVKTKSQIVHDDAVLEFVENLFKFCYRDDQGRLRHGENADVPGADLVQFVCDNLSSLFDIEDMEAKECVTCTMCGDKCDKKTAHNHQGKLIGDECCWTEQLRATE